ncbi:ABC transporter substrate-binding protein [Desulfosporosinus sp. PR]|uniref:endolytic transglycosylase MltG n=1 Tax=Candidatus Desulfosporosinus nitrosoreducens TaxID=3401928 RepID=UPI0027F76D2D|nr:ABC transporter substrate-binding protein [Desulfosporosinus sp. PR]MDQ7094145.1 ABC transporter substrate-binding protein [Desulfosporosinus sp. PR]
MKVSRSYWLGLGSGLILSAMLTLVISPAQGHFSAANETTSSQSAKQQVSQQPAEKTEKPLQSAETGKPVAAQLSQVTPSPSPEVSPIERDFVVPQGASADKIADLLAAQGYIKDKEAFLASARQLGAESKFRTGKFTLTLGLTPEELIHRLLKN